MPGVWSRFLSLSPWPDSPYERASPDRGCDCRPWCVQLLVFARRSGRRTRGRQGADRRERADVARALNALTPSAISSAARTPLATGGGRRPEGRVGGGRLDHPPHQEPVHGAHWGTRARGRARRAFFSAQPPQKKKKKRSVARTVWTIAYCFLALSAPRCLPRLPEQKDTHTQAHIQSSSTPPHPHTPWTARIPSPRSPRPTRPA